MLLINLFILKWHIRRIEEVLTGGGADGPVRGAKVMCSGPSGRRTTMQRPIQKLVHACRNP